MSETADQWVIGWLGHIYSMGLRDLCRNTVLRMDMLCAPNILRVRGEPDYETMCGGIFSMVIMAAFGAIFYSSLMNVLNKLEINYHTSFADDTSSEESINHVQFAIGIDDVDFSSTPWQFTISLKQVNLSESSGGGGGGGRQSASNDVVMSPCKLEDWQLLGENFDKQFNGFGFDKMLCLDSNSTYELYGYQGQIPYRFLQLEINICNRGPDCDSYANISAEMATYLSTNNYYNVRFFMVNTILSPEDQEPENHIIEKNIKLTYTDTTGTIGYVYVGDYEIQTDKSLLPRQVSFDDIEVKQGVFLDTFTTTTVPITNINSTLVEFNIYKSTRTITVTREYQKIDDFLSYVGGLFGLIFAFIAFFFASYSEYCYQLYVAQNTFALDSSGKPYNTDNFNFITYLAYTIYDWLDSFHIVPPCQSLKQIHQVRDEATAQLDVVTILKRLNHLQNMSKILLSEHQQLALAMTAPPTLEEAEKYRQIIFYHDNLLKDINDGKAGPKHQEKHSSNNDEHQQIIAQMKSAISNNGNNSSATIEPSEGSNDEDELTEKFSDAMRQLKRYDGPHQQKIRQKLLPEVREYFGIDESPAPAAVKIEQPSNSFQSLFVQPAQPTRPKRKSRRF